MKQQNRSRKNGEETQDQEFSTSEEAARKRKKEGTRTNPALKKSIWDVVKKWF
jgi:hypothetical protein